MFFYWSIVFYICLKGPRKRERSYHLWTALSLPDKSKSVGFKSFKSFLIHIICPQPFLLEYFTIVWLFFFLLRQCSIQFYPHKYQLQYVAKLFTLFSQGHHVQLIRYVDYLHTLPSGVQCISPALTFKGSYLFHYGIVDFFTNFSIWFQPPEFSIWISYFIS